MYIQMYIRNPRVQIFKNSEIIWIMFLVRSKVPGNMFLLLPPLVKSTKKDWIKNSWKYVYGKYKKGDKKIVPDC